MPVQFITDPLPVTNQGERHIAAVLLVDTSGSMTGKPIEELNQGLVEFGSALEEDSLALGRADICIISFDSNVRTEMSFRPATEYKAPKLCANGVTSMNGAIEAALDALESRKAEYRSLGVSYYRPWLFVLTDGVPTDNEKESSARARLQKAIKNKKIVYMPMGIGENADITSAKTVLKASADNFKEAFVWLSNSIGVISQSDPSVTDQVQLPPTPSIITVGI